MTKKLAVGIVFCFSASVGVIALLILQARNLRQQPGSFLREFPPHPVEEGDTINLKYNSYYIAGGTSHTVYLGNYTAPLHLLQVDLATLDTQHVRLNAQGIREQKFWAARVKVDSPYYYITDGVVPIIYKGDVGNWSAYKYGNDSTYFREIVPLTVNSLVVKSLSGDTRENILGKITTWAPYESFTDQILVKQIDGVFCTDGRLQFDKAFNKLVYLYYYRNEFIVMDTSLNVQYRGHTIDTTTHAKISVATIDSEHAKTLSSPPYFVNKQSCASGNWLFVNSSLMAKNENANAFNSGEVIDVYNIGDGSYKLSFYIYHYWRTKRMTEFKVFEDKMVVLYGDLLRVFELRPGFLI